MGVVATKWVWSTTVPILNLEKLAPMQLYTIKLPPSPLLSIPPPPPSKISVYSTGTVRLRNVRGGGGRVGKGHS